MREIVCLGTATRWRASSSEARRPRRRALPRGSTCRSTGQRPPTRSSGRPPTPSTCCSGSSRSSTRPSTTATSPSPRPTSTTTTSAPPSTSPRDGRPAVERLPGLRHRALAVRAHRPARPRPRRLARRRRGRAPRAATGGPAVTTTLITGADGYVGRRIAAALLGRDRRPARAGRARRRHARSSPASGALLAELTPRPSARVTVVPPTCATPSRSPASTRRVTRIIHAAAVTRVQRRARARRVRSTSTGTAQAAARSPPRCPDLERLVLLSTLYSAGGAGGEWPSEPARRRRRASSTTTSGRSGRPSARCSPRPRPARAVVRLRDGRSPTTTPARSPSTTPSTTRSGSSTTGCSRWCPATRRRRCTWSPATCRGRVIVHLLAGGRRAASTTSAPDRSDALHAAASWSTSRSTCSSATTASARRRLLRPLFCDRGQLRRPGRGARSLGGGPLSQALASCRPFAEQLYLRKDVRNDAAARRLAGLRRARPARLAAATAAPGGHPVGPHASAASCADVIDHDPLQLRERAVAAQLLPHLRDQRRAVLRPRRPHGAARAAPGRRHPSLRRRGQPRPLLDASASRDLGSDALKLERRYQDQYLEAAGVPANLMEVWPSPRYSRSG